MNTTPTSAFTLDEVLKASWAITKKHWTQFLVIGLVALALYIAYGILYAVLDSAIGIPGIVDSLLSFLIGVYVSIFTARGALTIVREEKLDIATITKFDGKLFLHAALATVLFYLVVVVGLILLIIPGIIAAIMFSFYIYSLVDKHTEAVQALEDSMNMTKGNKLTIFLYNIVLGLIGILVLGVPALLVFGVAGFSLSEGGGAGPMIIIGILYLIFAVVVAFLLGAMSMSGQGYMYLKMRAKTPLQIKK